MISESTLSAYIDGTLDADQHAAVEAAIEQSPELRSEVERLQSVDRALTNYGVTVMASTAAFRSDVYHNVSSTYVAPAASGLSGGMVATIAAVTSALVAGGLWYTIGTSQPATTVVPSPVAVVREAAPADEVVTPPAIESTPQPAQRSRAVRRTQPLSAVPTTPDMSRKDAPPYSSKSSEEIQRESKLAGELKKLETKISTAERNGDHAIVSSLARKAAITAGKLGDRNMQTTMWERAIRAAEMAGDNARANQYRWEQQISVED